MAVADFVSRDTMVNDQVWRLLHAVHTKDGSRQPDPMTFKPLTPVPATVAASSPRASDATVQVDTDAGYTLADAFNKMGDMLDG